MEMNNTCRVCKQILLIQVLKVQNYLGTIYIYMRWIQLTLCVITFFKPLDLNRSNRQQKVLINANILIKISFIIPYL